MLPARIVESIDILEDRGFGLPACLLGLSPDQFCLDRLEERFHGGVVIAIAFAAHRYFEAMLAQDLLIIM